MEQELNHLDQKSLNDSWNLDNENYDKDVLLQTVFIRGGTFEPIFSNPSYYYNMVSFWWSRWSRNFEKWFDALDIEYNPLENYDRQESWHDDIVDASTLDATNSNSGTLDGNDSVTEIVDDDTTTDNTSTLSVSAYDSSSYSPKEQTVDSGSGTDDRTTTTTSITDHETSDTTTIDQESSNDRDVDHIGRVHGNIGVTTSQQMLQSELEIQKWNVYNHIADIFLNEMAIQVY